LRPTPPSASSRATASTITGFTPIGSSGYSGVQIPVSAGEHCLVSPLPFGAFSYGWGLTESYGYPVDMCLAPARPTNTPPEVTCPGLVCVCGRLATA
jgi:hypothetical protein